VSVRGISDLERGLRRTPHPATLRRLAEALNLDDAERTALSVVASATPAVREATELPQTRYARSGDISVAYQVFGSGPIDVVFIMGWVSNLDFFWQEPRFARFLTRLASFARVIMFDKRGTGLSDRGVGLPSLEQRMDDVRAVMDAAGSERAALVGISEAGALCLTFAATYPQRTTALALLGCYPRRQWAEDYPWGATPASRDRRIRAIEAGWGSREWARQDLETRAPGVAHDEHFSQWWATYLRMSASPGAAVDFTRMASQIDVRPILPTIHVPTLVIHRVGDRQVSVEAGRYMATQIPTARYLELPGDDHLPFVGDQDAMLDPLEAFLSGSQPAEESDRVLATVLALDPVADANVLRSQLERFRGRAAGTAAAEFATFDGPARGIRCAVAIVDESRMRGAVPRAALHTGECDLVGDSLGGVPFRIAASAMAHAEPGEVLVSRTVRDLVAGSGIQFEEYSRPLAPAGLGPWLVVKPARP
jgi:pimeloyl-ACP methyl ester carboxylesterase